jgi:hypothetical protein
MILSLFLLFLDVQLLAHALLSRDAEEGSDESDQCAETSGLTHCQIVADESYEYHGKQYQQTHVAPHTIVM